MKQPILNRVERLSIGLGLTALAAAGIAYLAPAPSNARAEDKSVFGIWETKGGKSHVEIAPCDGAVCGKIIWLREPLDDRGQPKIDKNNRREDLAQRPVLGLPLLTGFIRADGPGLYGDGTIYNPEDGNSYSSEMALQPDGSLKVEGCVLFFCREQIWNRVR